MSDSGNLQIGDIKKKKEDLNKTGGINTSKALFETNNEGAGGIDSPYAMPSRVEQLANRGPIMQSRIHTTNPNDIAFAKKVEGGRSQGATKTEQASKARSDEKSTIIKAQPDLKEFTGDAMKKGVFTPRAKEAARHFFKQISDWAGSFDDGGSGFYSSMGISGVLDCLYVDGMSLRNYLKEQYFYKATGNPVQDQENVRNYVALIAARGEHVITLVRPHAHGEEASVEYKNLYLDLSNVGEKEAAKSRKLKEKGNQVRSVLKKRIDSEMTRRTGMAFRKAYGYNNKGLKRIEGVHDGLVGAEEGASYEYKSFEKNFENYNSGLQKLGLKPGRDDINLAVAMELKNRCEEALKAAVKLLDHGVEEGPAKKAVEAAREALETDLHLLEHTISTRLDDENARIRFDELFEEGTPDKGKGPGVGTDGDEGDTGSDDDGSRDAGSEGGAE